MKQNVSIYWIRQDLRLNDNPALTASVKIGSIIPIYILDDENPKEHKIGSSSKIWLHYSSEDKVNAYLIIRDTQAKTPLVDEQCIFNLIEQPSFDLNKRINILL